MAVPPLDKETLRSELRAARRTFAQGKDFLALLSPLQWKMINDKLSGVRCVAGYQPMRGEPDVMPLMDMALASGRSAALPRVWNAGVMDFASWEKGQELVYWGGIAQPDPAVKEMTPDLILIPLVGFDRQGYRLGQGGGYYDRVLERHPQAFKLGIAWSVQEVAHIPVEPHDIPLDAILTEKEWIE